MKYKILILFSLLIPLLFGQNLDVDDSLADHHWVDVTNPLSWDGMDHPKARDACIKYDEELIKCEKELKQKKIEVENNDRSTEDVILKHVIRQFLDKLNIQLHLGVSVDTEAVVRLSSEDVKVLHSYLEANENSSPFLRDNVRLALSNFLTPNEFEISWITRFFERYQSYIFTINMLILPLASIYLFKQIMGLRGFLIMLFLAAFLVSIAFTYMRKYNEVLAEKFSRISDDNDQCSPKGTMADAVDVILGYIRIKGKSECLKKYEDLFIHPILKIDPLHVIGEVLTTFFMSPFTIGGTHLNKFFNDFFIDTPIPLLVVKLIFLILTFFFLFGYRIRTFLWTLEPARPIPTSISAPALDSGTAIEQINTSTITPATKRPISAINNDCEVNSHSTTDDAITSSPTP